MDKFEQLIQCYDDNFINIRDFSAEMADKIEALEKENRRLSMNLSTLQGNMDAVMTILKDLVKNDWEKE